MNRDPFGIVVLAQQGWRMKKNKGVGVTAQLITRLLDGDELTTAAVMKLVDLGPQQK